MLDALPSVADEAPSVADELSVEEPESDEPESEPPDPALLPLLVMATLHDFVSRTSGSPLSPVIGSSWIVHVWSMGPTALRMIQPLTLRPR